MFASSVQSHIHFKHAPEEVARLAAAITPLHDNLIAVSSSFERGNIKKILGCQYFRRRDAASMRAALLRTAKHAKLNLADYFPLMREGILVQAKELEDATEAYWLQFSLDLVGTEPTH